MTAVVIWGGGTRDEEGAGAMGTGNVVDGGGTMGTGNVSDGGTMGSGH